MINAVRISIMMEYRPQRTIKCWLAFSLVIRRLSMSEWEPKIVSFLCNWCSYGAADVAGVSRMEYPANIRVVRIPCTGRMSPKFALAALREGADAVWVSG